MSEREVRWLADAVAAGTQYAFDAQEVREPSAVYAADLWPEGYPRANTFTVRVEVLWRRVRVSVRPGTFAGELLSSMGRADGARRGAFIAVLAGCQSDGAQTELNVNGSIRDPNDETLWNVEWRSLTLTLSKPLPDINQGDAAVDRREISAWVVRAVAVMLTLMPADDSPEEEPAARGLPEGARIRVEVNRYERDRRNRVAAIALHGDACGACGLRLADRYGPCAEGLIEMHHVVPVSELGEDYEIDVREDLVPLCPNCHAVAHRRSPPYSAGELRDMLLEL